MGDYKPRKDGLAASVPIDPECCREEVYITVGRAGFFAQCSRKKKRDNYCRQHHPEAVAAREEARKAKVRARLEKVDEKGTQALLGRIAWQFGFRDAASLTKVLEEDAGKEEAR